MGTESRLFRSNNNYVQCMVPKRPISLLLYQSGSLLYLLWLRNPRIQLFRTDKAKNVGFTKKIRPGG